MFRGYPSAATPSCCRDDREGKPSLASARNRELHACSGRMSEWAVEGALLFRCPRRCVEVVVVVLIIVVVFADQACGNCHCSTLQSKDRWRKAVEPMLDLSSRRS